MHCKTAALLASILLVPFGAALAPARAQVAAGNEVSVNPLPAGGAVLLYPGDQYERTVPHLLQPGQTARDSGPIILHMPGKHVARAAPHRPPSAETAAAPPPKPRRRVAVARPSAPPPATAPHRAAAAGYDPGYGNFGEPANLGAAGLGATVIAHPSASPPAAAAPQRQLAKAEPAPATTAPPASQAPTPGLTKESMILFAAGAADPAQSAMDAIKFLAGNLNSAMAGPASRVQIMAYGGAKGDKGSDARRLSLKRALAIRQVLIDDGVPSERIDVRAMGGADDGGPADRVDVYVKA